MRRLNTSGIPKTYKIWGTLEAAGPTCPALSRFLLGNAPLIFCEESCRTVGKSNQLQ